MPLCSAGASAPPPLHPPYMARCAPAAPATVSSTLPCTTPLDGQAPTETSTAVSARPIRRTADTGDVPHATQPSAQHARPRPTARRISICEVTSSYVTNATRSKASHTTAPPETHGAVPGHATHAACAHGPRATTMTSAPTAPQSRIPSACHARYSSSYTTPPTLARKDTACSSKPSMG